MLLIVEHGSMGGFNAFVVLTNSLLLFLSLQLLSTFSDIDALGIRDEARFSSLHFFFHLISKEDVFGLASAISH